MIAALALLLGLIAGLAAGGKVRNLMGLRLRYEAVLLTAFVVQGIARGRIAGTDATPWGMPVWVVASVALCVLLAANLKLSGALVAASGVLLNLLVVLANGGMPVAASNVDAGGAVAQSASFYHSANGGTLAIWVGDAMEFALGGAQFLLSPGDTLLAVGVASLMVGAMLDRERT
jgi:hypothetical protein